MDYKDFRREVLGLNKPRFHEVQNSYGVFDAFKYYRKVKPCDEKYVLTESQYFSIIRSVNKLLAEQLLDNNDIVFPLRMGKLELRKMPTTLKIVDGKLINRLPIDWDRTIKLWASDQDAYDMRTLVRLEEKETFKILYNKSNANYNNKTFYQFNVNRQLKIELKKRIKENKIDAFDLWPNNNKALR